MGHFFGAKVNNLMRLYPNRIGQIDYHYVPSMVGVHPTTVMPEEYICELNKQLPYEIKKVEWNFGLKNGQLITEVPSHLREYDLVILNGGLSSLLPYVEGEYELKKWLQTVVMEKVLKPQGKHNHSSFSLYHLFSSHIIISFISLHLIYHLSVVLF